jgi:hypothetical protein
MYKTEKRANCPLFGRAVYNTRYMRKILFVLTLSFLLATPVRAEVVSSPLAAASVVPDATQSADSTPAAIIETPSPEPKTDLTQPTGQTRDQLEQLIVDHPTGPLTWKNFLRYAMERAVGNGMPVNTVVLILLFPLVVAIVAAARHLIGVRGVGILTPALLAVAFLATGIWVGVGLFLIILMVATASRFLLRKLKLQYMPRLALLLWFVSAGVLGTLFLAAYFSLGSVLTVGIFPILILMLLAETFIDIQQGRSASEAKDIIFQTFLLAMISSLLLAWQQVQRVVVLYPELVFFGVAIFDIFIGKYTGLRLTEYLMFKRVTQDDEEE